MGVNIHQLAKSMVRIGFIPADMEQHVTHVFCKHCRRLEVGLRIPEETHSHHHSACSALKVCLWCGHAFHTNTRPKGDPGAWDDSTDDLQRVFAKGWREYREEYHR